MELFKLFGKIAVENAEANAAVDETTEKAQSSSNKIKSSFEKIGSALSSVFKNNGAKAFGDSLKGLTGTIDKQEQELEKLKNRYKDLYLTQGKNSNEAKACAKEIEDLSAELKQNKDALKEAENAADKFDDTLDDVSDSADDASGSMSEGFKKIGTAVATYFAADKIVDFGKEVVNTAAEVSAEASAFEQIMGDYADEASAKVGKIADATGMVDTRLTPYMTSMTAKFKGLGYDVEDATSYASRGLNLAADASAFWDKSLDESMSHLNSFINGSYEGGEAIGLFANDTQMAMYAVEQGLIKDTKEWANLEESIKQATRLEYAENMMKSSGATGQAAKEAGQYANVQANLNEKWRQFKANIGEPLLQNVVIPAMSKLSGFVDIAAVKFQDLKKWVSDNKETFEKLASAAKTVVDKIKDFIQWLNSGSTGAEAFKAVVIAVTTALVAFKAVLEIKSAWTSFIGLIGKAKTAFAALSATMSANPIGLVIAAVSALVAAFIYLWNNCEPFKQFWIDLWDKIKVAAKAVADWFVSAWEAIGLFFTETVPGWFNSFKEFFVGIWDSVKEAARVVADWFIEKWETISSFFTETIPEKFNSFKDKLSEIWQKCVDKVSEVWNTIREYVEFGIQIIASIFDAALQIILLPFTFLWENCKEYVFAAFEWMKEKIDAAITKIKEIAEIGFNFVKEKIINPIIEAKNFVVEKFNELKEKAQAKIEQFKEKASEAFNTIKEKVITPILDAKNAVVEKFNELKEKAQEKINSLKEKATSAFNSIKEKITTAITNAKNTAIEKFNELKEKAQQKFTELKEKASNLFNQIKEKITTPINNAKAKATEIFNNLKSTVTSKIESLRSTVQSKFNDIKNKIQDPIKTAKEKVEGFINDIKGFFDKLKLKFPSIKMPHFKITGEFSIEKKTVPSLSIEWYKKAYDTPMLMNSPTIFGYNQSTGSLMGGGDGNGKTEVVSGAETLMAMIQAAVSAENSAIAYYLKQIIEILADFFPEIVEKLDFDYDFDEDRLIKRIAPGMDKELGIIARKKVRGG